MKQSFLLLEEGASPTERKVRFVTSLAAGVRVWGVLTRVSPLFSLGKHRPGVRLPKEKESYRLIFIGPGRPQRVVDLLDQVRDVWLTLGAYNVVARLEESDHKRVTRALAEASLPYEIWDVTGGVVNAVDYSRSPGTFDKMSEIAAVLSGPIYPELRELVHEYAPLMAAAAARAARVLPDAVPDLVSINQFVAGCLAVSNGTPSTAEEEEENHERLGLLTALNAGLSRFSSQAFSGISPIAATESHFWSHSLLGTGTANIGMLKYIAFIVSRLGHARIPQRLEKLAYLPLPRGRALEDISGSDEWWYQNQLASIVVDPAECEPPVPLITYFSGRDGFKSTPLTLSAPLAVIPSCNSLRWTLQTITHEISHTFIRGVLAVLYPDADSAVEIDAAMSLLQPSPAANHLDALKRYLLLTLHMMESVEDGRPLQTEREWDADGLRQLLNKWHDNIEELLVHTFDFLTFYDGNRERYIEAIWLSWSVIPNISYRVPDYVLRTLCAVHSLNLRRDAAAEEFTRGEVCEILETLHAAHPTASYIQQAIHHIKAEWKSSLQPALKARRGLIRIVKAYLHSAELAVSLTRESRLVGGASERGGYPHKIGEFTNDPIDNPLWFIEQYTRNVKPSAQTSAWIWSMLAYNVESDVRQAG
jgi:hypothetical protein